MDPMLDFSATSYGVSVYLQDFSIEIARPPSAGSSSEKEAALPSPTAYLLQPLTAHLPGGELFAILGGSGSGKTTLLNAIAGRYDRSAYQIGGSIAFSRIAGPHAPRVGRNSCSVAYVTQEDFLHPHLTVRETLHFTARLKLPASSSHGDVHEKAVSEVIMELGLKECADSLIGSDDGSVGRGISGGEKRRVSIALQILNHPEVLCADEPTSGLDSFTACTVMECLQRLTRRKSSRNAAGGAQVNSAGQEYAHDTTVICSIHQPRSDIFQLFHSVLLLSAGGQVVYCGAVSAMLGYFDQLGYACPEHANPADYFIDLTGVDNSSPEKRSSSQARLDHLLTAYHHNQQVQTTAPHVISVESAVPSISWMEQVGVLCRRLLLTTCRDSSHVYGALGQALIEGLVVMTIFWQLPMTVSGISSRSGVSYIVVSVEYYILMIILIQRYCYELRLLVDRELQDGLYHPTAYYAAHWLVSWPLFFVQAVLYAVPIYFGCDLRSGGDHFFIFLAVNCLLMLIINSLAWVCVTVQRDFTVASLIGNMNFTFISLTAGFLVNYDSMPIYVHWVKNISILSYAYRIIMSNEFSERDMDVDGMTVSGDDVLDSYGVNVNDFPEPFAVLCGIGLAYNVVALLAFTYQRFPPTGSVAVSFQEDKGLDSEEAGQMTGLLQDIENPVQYTAVSNEDTDLPEGAGEVSGVRIDLVHLHLSVQQQGGRSLKHILKDIHATITPGRLVAIMGGSGSGKTTLLNLLANRIPMSCLSMPHSSQSQSLFAPASSQYTGKGEILFNQRLLQSSELRRIIAYVQQFDFHLPSLTVLETLQFHARLRLGGEDVTEEHLTRRVHEVIHTLNLSSCAHVRVGDDTMKGISGGEKRRLSIGIQLLDSPAVCLLDEPTTGLDAYTARRVVLLLRHLAHTPYRENLYRTIILSIHQPRYDIFACFDDVLLLSRGQLVWAGDAAAMYRHFQGIGHPFPVLCNPADFLLDISSIDFRSVDKEVASRERLDGLVAAFQTYLLEHPQADVSQKAIMPMASTDASHCKPLSFTLPLLLQRSFVNLLRQPILLTNRMSQGLFYALILCCFYAPIGDDQASVQNRIGNLYELTALCFVGMLSCIAIYPSERNVFYREYPDGHYSAMAFALCYFIIAIPILLATALGIAALITYAVGLQASVMAMLKFTICIFTFIFVGECTGVAFCSFFMQVGFSINLMSAVLSFLGIMAGYISIDMPVFLDYLSYISPLKWGAFLLTNIAFKDKTFTCSDTDSSCLSTGEQVLDLYNMQPGSGTNSMNFHAIMLAVVTLIYFLVALLAVRWRARMISH